MGEETWSFQYTSVSHGPLAPLLQRGISVQQRVLSGSYKVTMNKLFFVAVVTLVVVALGGVDAQRRVYVSHVSRVSTLSRKAKTTKNGKSHVCWGVSLRTTRRSFLGVPIVARVPIASNSSKGAKPSPKSSPATKPSRPRRLAVMVWCFLCRRIYRRPAMVTFWPI